MGSISPVVHLTWSSRHTGDSDHGLDDGRLGGRGSGELCQTARIMWTQKPHTHM